MQYLFLCIIPVYSALLLSLSQCALASLAQQLAFAEASFSLQQAFCSLQHAFSSSEDALQQAFFDESQLDAKALSCAFEQLDLQQSTFANDNTASVSITNSAKTSPNIFHVFPF